MRGYRIKTVARLTGLSEAVLRTWERRYQVVEPRRTPGGYREYTPADVERLRRLRVLTESGHSISEVATWSEEELALPAEEGEESSPQPGDPSPVPPPSARVESLKAAALQLDALRLAAEIREALLLASPAAVARELLLPTLQALEATEKGSRASPASALAREGVRGFLGGMTFGLEEGAPKVLCASGPGSDGDGMALRAWLLARSEGWFPLLLGGGVTAPEILGITRSFHPEVVVVTFAPGPDSTTLLASLDALCRGLPRECALIFAGASLADHHGAIERKGAALAQGEKALRGALQAVRERTEKESLDG